MARKRKRHPVTPETTLYAPVKRYLEALGFTVKGEVCGCDLVALRGDEPPIMVVGGRGGPRRGVLSAAMVVGLVDA